MTALVERTRCPSCEGGATSTLYSRPYAHPSVWPRVSQRYPGRLHRRALSGRRYEIASCDHCRLLFQRFVPCAASLRRLYGEWLSDPSEPVGSKAPPLLAGPLPGRILDFGAGDGRFCRAAHASGLEVVAIDIAEPRLSPLRTLGIEAHTSVDELTKTNFGLIRCHRILEHLPHPFETLHKLTDRLAPGGRLELCVPDAVRWARGVRRGFWDAAGSPLRPLEQLNGFSSRAVEVLARRLDLVAWEQAPAPWNGREHDGLLFRALEHRPHGDAGRRRAA